MTRTKRWWFVCCLAAAAAGCASTRRHAPRSGGLTFDELLVSGGSPGDSRESKLLPEFFSSGWDAPVNGARDEIDAFAQGYLGFLHEVRTGRDLFRAVRRFAADNGFAPADLYGTAGAPEPGTALVFEDAGSGNIALVRAGRRPVEEGCRIYIASTDLPAMEIKPHALYPQHGFVLLQTAYTGYVRKHQWLSVPLGLSGQVFRDDGPPADVELGMDGGGVLVIPDLLPHLAYAEQQHRLIPAERLDAVAALRPDDGDTLSTAFMDALHEASGIGRDDFVRARFELVPVAPPVEAGVDRGLVGGYGQSAKLPVYLGLEAFAETDAPEFTVIMLAARGMNEYEEFSTYPPVLGDLLRALTGSPDGVGSALRNAVAVAGGTMPAVNPLYKDGWAEPSYGPVVILDGADNGAARRLVGLLVREEALWQKNDTPYRHPYPALAAEREGIACVNVLCPLLAEGSFCELASKMDLFLTYDALRAFFSATEF